MIKLIQKMKSHSNIFLKLKPKNFEELYNYISKNSEEMKQEDGLTIFIYCCTICIQCKEETISEYHLKSSLKKGFDLISSLNEGKLVQYLQAIYHIVKCLIEKVSITSLTAGQNKFQFCTFWIQFLIICEDLLNLILSCSSENINEL